MSAKVTCNDCHDPHEGGAIMGGGTQLATEFETCGKCHTAQRGPFDGLAVLPVLQVHVRGVHGLESAGAVRHVVKRQLGLRLVERDAVDREVLHSL